MKLLSIEDASKAMSNDRYNILGKIKYRNFTELCYYCDSSGGFLIKKINIHNHTIFSGDKYWSLTEDEVESMVLPRII